jgi:hypothetical protein
MKNFDTSAASSNVVAAGGFGFLIRRIPAAHESSGIYMASSSAVSLIHKPARTGPHFDIRPLVLVIYVFRLTTASRCFHNALSIRALKVFLSLTRTT